MPIAAPTIDMIATGANIRALIKGKGLKVTDVVLLSQSEEDTLGCSPL